MAEVRSIHSFFLTAPNQHRPFCDLAGRTAQPCPSPALCTLFPHPLQNRVPKGAGHLWRSAAPVSAPASVSAGLSPLGSSTPAGSRDQVLLPLPQNRRKHWVFAGSLFSCVAWFCGSLWFKLRVFPSGFTRSQPFPPSPAPKTHPTSAIFA